MKSFRPGWARFTARAAPAALAAAVVAAAALALMVVGLGTSCSRQPVTADGWNLLLVSLDTVRADRLGAYGYSVAETPHLDRLAAGGLRFESAFTAAPLTLPAHATLLTGLTPLDHGVHQNGSAGLPASVPTLATRLDAAGYRTGAFVGAFVLHRRFGLGRGFDRYDDAVDRGTLAEARLEAERPASEVVDRALEWIAEGADEGEPFFAWVHLYDAHAPHLPPEPFASRHRGRPYDGEIAAVDAAVGRLLAALEERGLAGRTVVAVVADHGEGLGDHGESTHGLLLYQSTLRVPLIVRAPGALPAGRRIETPVGLVDLAPTLAGLLGVAAPAASAESPGGSAPPTAGRDLSAALGRGEPPAAPIYAETRYPAVFRWSPLSALVDGDYKYIHGPDPELYHLTADPAETDDLLDRERRRARELGGRLAALEADAESTPAPVRAAPLDEESRRRLESLGYVAPPPTDAGGAGGDDPKARVALFVAFEEAVTALGLGEAALAEATLSRLLAADPDNPVFAGKLAEALGADGRHEEALPLYRRAVELDPDDPRAWYNLAVALDDSGRREESRQAIGEALARAPENPEARNAFGVALAAEGRFEAARRELERALRTDPGNARAYNNLGNALRALGEPDRAETAYREAARLATRYVDPLNGLGTLEVERQRPRAAVEFFDRALALAPERVDIRLNRAIALGEAGDLESAAAEYRRVLSAAGDDPRLRREAGAARALLAGLEAKKGGRG